MGFDNLKLMKIYYLYPMDKNNIISFCLKTNYDEDFNFFKKINQPIDIVVFVHTESNYYLFKNIKFISATKMFNFLLIDFSFENKNIITVEYNRYKKIKNILDSI